MAKELEVLNRPQLVDDLKRIPWGHLRFIIDFCKVLHYQSEFPNMNFQNFIHQILRVTCLQSKKLRNL